MSELMKVPTGWMAVAWPAGWNPSAPEEQPLSLHQVGYVLLPNSFTLAIIPPNGLIPATDGLNPQGFLLKYEIQKENLINWDIMGVSIDISAGLKTLIENIPPEKWEGLAVTKITEFLAFEDHRQIPPDLQQRDQAQMYESQGSQPEKKRRITEDHLSEVASVYKEAQSEGRPPTRAVQEYFSVSHSTAAKWVGAARRKKILPPAGKKGVDH